MILRHLRRFLSKEMKNDKGSFSVEENEEFVKVERCDFVACGKHFETVLQ